MRLSYSECIIDIDDNQINCCYPTPLNTISWKIVLNDTEIYYTDGQKKERVFKINEISELQFEMSSAGGRYEDVPACTAYVILKTDTDPREFFHFFVREEYGLFNQTKAYDFCSTILNHISGRYHIPNSYK